MKRKSLAVRITPEAYARIQKCAERQGEPMAEIARQMLQLGYREWLLDKKIDAEIAAAKAAKQAVSA